MPITDTDLNTLSNHFKALLVRKDALQTQKDQIQAKRTLINAKLDEVNSSLAALATEIQNTRQQIKQGA